MQINVLPNFALTRGAASLDRQRGKADNPDTERQRLKQAAQEFEGIMLELMVKEMRKNVPESPIFGQDTGREIFNEMLDGQYVKIMVDRGGVGLADLMVRQLDPRR